MAQIICYYPLQCGQEYKVKKWGNGRSNSGPAGYKSRPARVEGRNKGDAFVRARKRPIWQLLATEGNSMIRKGENYNASG